MNWHYHRRFIQAPLSSKLVSGRVGEQYSNRGQAGNQTAASRRENGSNSNLELPSVAPPRRSRGAGMRT